MFGIDTLLKIFIEYLLLLHNQTLFHVLGHSSDPKKANPHKTKLLSSQDLNSSGDTPNFKENVTILLHMGEPYITSKTAQESNRCGVKLIHKY